ncbi:hypothetical protein SERLA73DRAFT_44764 [Serpula lacrymans var. lacrymans S7.3]|uniref:Uncharacterized protein n=1 Tax=Serpula lacrymans var. lacrymans (strain S7.3) TaxID=936435 RepID=F8PFG4_SERL3|nr:hypothetical protein SERLA73DRAFT_44764 [Serpula lacrymans var. lacrymans S7.3]
MCALFIGRKVKPTRENMMSLCPVLISKQCVQRLIEFLVQHNSWYSSAGISMSVTNLDALYPENEAVPAGVQICHMDNVQGADAATASYDNLREFHNTLTDVITPGHNLVMDAVGYTLGDNTPQNHKLMKAQVLACVLDGGKFVEMQVSSEFLNDSNPGFLMYLFPHLNPWGIAGFNESNCCPDQKILFEQQLRNLLQQHDSPFQKDPRFVYICWNILQKREVNKSTLFTVSACERDTIVEEVHEIAPDLTAMIAQWEHSPGAKPSTRQEKRTMKVLNHFKYVARELKGSFGYKFYCTHTAKPTHSWQHHRSNNCDGKRGTGEPPKHQTMLQPHGPCTNNLVVSRKWEHSDRHLYGTKTPSNANEPNLI